MDNQAARDILTHHLRSGRKHRITPERFAILDAVLEIQGHFDAESLYYRLMANGVRVSKATVYGLVSKYRFAENMSRYEKAFGRPHHHHLICLQCGDIIEFTNEKLDKIQEEACSARDFSAQSSALQIFGTCPKCKKKE
jgi:Fur family transcriptional regulator, ferric uptake regulator